jgi:hypothetical protein
VPVSLCDNGVSRQTGAMALRSGAHRAVNGPTTHQNTMNKSNVVSNGQRNRKGQRASGDISAKSEIATTAAESVKVDLNGSSAVENSPADVGNSLRDSLRDAANSGAVVDAAATVNRVLDSIQAGNGIVVEPVAKVTSTGVAVRTSRELFAESYKSVIERARLTEKTEKDLFNSFKVFSECKWLSPAEDADTRKYRQTVWQEFKAACRDAMGIEVTLNGNAAPVQRISNPRVVWDSRTGMPKRWSQTLTIGGDIPESAIAEHVESLKAAHAAVAKLIGC